ncbi:hypothetical protein K7432_004919 [Basidiobolus ranarum]|uniref:Pinin/SDK/MemA protein domain-containing protein n=1 Tax=Basidiobolus ranarum TaxID=34480 RepID=A0ABR2WXB9_9FUNG
MEVDRRDEVIESVESQSITQIQTTESLKEEVSTVVIETKEEVKVIDKVDNALKRRLSNANSDHEENTADQNTAETKAPNTEDSHETKRPRLVEDKEVKRRGQRMFGMLLGTLNKIKDQSKHKSEAEIKREKLEQKLQEKLKKEKEELAEKVKVEQESRKEKILAQRKVDERKRKGELRENLKNQKNKLAGFLKTKTTPALYYLPAKPSGRHMDTIAEQKKTVEEEFKKLEEQDEEEDHMEQDNSTHPEDQPMEDSSVPEVTTGDKEIESNANKPDSTQAEDIAEKKPSNDNPINPTEQPTTVPSTESEQTTSAMEFESSKQSIQKE